MPATTRAKFRCHQIDLRHVQIINPELKSEDDKLAEAKERGLPYQIDFAQPTVKLSAVYPSPESPENERFFAASPSGTVEVTISNPAGAEIFEIGKEYYVDFTPAPVATPAG